MDMMPPIWLWARRCSSQKMPTNSTTGMSSGRNASKIEGCGFENLTSTSCSRNSARSSSGGSFGPFERELGAVGELAGDGAAVVGPGDLVDLVGGHLRPQVGVGDLLAVVARRQAHAAASNATSAPPRTQMAHRGICWPPEPEPEPEPRPDRDDRPGGGGGGGGGGDCWLIEDRIRARPWGAAIAHPPRSVVVPPSRGARLRTRPRRRVPWHGVRARPDRAATAPSRARSCRCRPRRPPPGQARSTRPRAGDRCAGASATPLSAGSSPRSAASSRSASSSR